MSRPEFNPTAEQRHTVSILSSLGKTVTEIAAVIGITRQTLRKHFADELLHAAARELSINLKILQRAADNGSTAATSALDAIFDDAAAARRLR